MNNRARILFTIICAVITIALNVNAQSSTANRTNVLAALQRGLAAYNNEKFQEALPDLVVAATAQLPDAFSPLINIYVDGEHNGNGKGDYREAFKWLLMAQQVYHNKATDNKSLAVTCLMYYGPLCFLIGDFEETIDNANRQPKEFPQNPYLTLQVAASYMKLGNITEAKNSINKAIVLANERNDNISIHTANALLSKIAFDRKDYSKAIALSKDAATVGQIPLAAFIYGASLIETRDHADIGKQWVKAAAEYDYNGLFEINCFESEIKYYWNSIH